MFCEFLKSRNSQNMVTRNNMSSLINNQQKLESISNKKEVFLSALWYNKEQQECSDLGHLFLSTKRNSNCRYTIPLKYDHIGQFHPIFRT
jgi:hypothetical protein